MFEIGSSLRAARMRQGRELEQAEADTRIRSRYLEALEDERFDLLPARAYARGFLRTYADYLGLDGQRFVDEYDSRLPYLEEPPIVPPRLPRPRALPSGIGAVAVVAVALLAVLAWQLGGSDERSPTPQPRAPTVLGADKAVRLRPARPKRQARPPARTARLVLTAARGSCWVSARLGSRDGRTIYEGTLEQGKSLRLTGKRLWLRLGAPSSLTGTVNGRSVALPRDTANVIVTSGRLTVAG
jgi:hypothetical protein